MHHHNLPEVELNQADHEAIDTMAEALASLHHLDASRVRKVLERLAVVCPEPPLPPAFEPINPPHRRLSFRPGFTQALARLPACEALSLLERVVLNPSSETHIFQSVPANVSSSNSHGGRYPSEECNRFRL